MREELKDSQIRNQSPILHSSHQEVINGDHVQLGVLEGSSHVLLQCLTGTVKVTQSILCVLDHSWLRVDGQGPVRIYNLYKVTDNKGHNVRGRGFGLLEVSRLPAIASGRVKNGLTKLLASHGS